MDSSIEFLPCPFCGGEPSYSVVHLPVTQTIYAVKCRSCTNVERHDKNRDECVKKWNTRSIPTITVDDFVERFIPPNTTGTERDYVVALMSEHASNLRMDFPRGFKIIRKDT